MNSFKKLTECLSGTAETLSVYDFELQIKRETMRSMKDDAEERRKRRSDAIMGRAAIPARFADKSLDVYRADSDKQKNILASCRDYANSFMAKNGANSTGASMILCGNPGTGKTHLAIGIAHQVLNSGGTAVYATAIQAIREIRETWGGRSGRSESDVIAGYVKPDLLVLDEVGVQFGTDAEKLHLFDLINARYEAVKPMIVISNLGLLKIEEFIGERAIDRLRECGGKAFVFDWESMRRK